MPGSPHPFHGAMPPPSQSSDPVDLTTVSAVAAFLDETPFASSSITELTGGSANYAYRLHLVTPFEGAQTLVLKHAQPHVKTFTALHFALIRQVRETKSYR